ncbi:MAG: hypothetical protein RLZZ28_687 [Bacteroidota bacterium]
MLPVIKGLNSTYLRFLIHAYEKTPPVCMHIACAYFLFRKEYIR